MSIEIRGAEQLAKLSRDLRAAGERELSRELTQGIRKGVEPGKINIKQHLGTDLPQRGGLARSMRGMRFNIRISGRNGVRLTASHRYQLKLIDQGMVRHPLFGDREHWYTTRFAPNVITDAWNETADQVRREVTDAAQRVANKIGR